MCHKKLTPSAKRSSLNRRKRKATKGSRNSSQTSTESRSPTKRQWSRSPSKSPSKRHKSPCKRCPKAKSDIKPSTRAKSKLPFIGSITEAPEFLRYNQYILNGYRINFNTPMKALKSLFLLHNQSFNVWSHLVAAVLFAALLIWTAVYTPSSLGNDFLTRLISEGNKIDSVICDVEFLERSTKINSAHLDALFDTE